MRRLTLLLSLPLCACAPTLVESSISNPASTKETIHAMQEYDQGPYKENHRYQVTLTNTSATTFSATIKLIDDVPACASPDSYTFSLVDDRGTLHAFHATGTPAQATETGRGGAKLISSTVTGDFDGAISPGAHAVTVQVRKAGGASCPEFDFRWDFK